jgi:hypothetical protein
MLFDLQDLRFGKSTNSLKPWSIQLTFPAIERRAGLIVNPRILPRVATVNSTSLQRTVIAQLQRWSVNQHEPPLVGI